MGSIRFMYINFGIDKWVNPNVVGTSITYDNIKNLPYDTFISLKKQPDNFIESIQKISLYETHEMKTHIVDDMLELRKTIL